MMTGYGDDICQECAKLQGCQWPEGHQATMWYAVCGICGEEKGVCSAGDWDWPDGKSHGMRD